MAETRGGGGGASFDQQVESFLDAMMQVESGGNNVPNAGGYSSATGYWQYTQPTWNGYGGYQRAMDAPYEVQRRRMREDTVAAYNRYDGDWERVIVAHFGGPGKADDDKSTWNHVPAPGNPTITSYVSKVMDTWSSGGGGGAVQTASARRDGGGGVQTAPAPDGGGGGGDAGGFGPTTSYASGFDPPAQSDDAAARALAYEIYGGMAEYFLNHPELGPIIAQAGKEGWDAGRLRGAVSQTDWWASTSQSQRAWESLNATDPGEAKARLDDRTADLLDEAARLGIQITNGRARQLAEMSLKVNWDGQDISRAIGQEGLRRDAPDRDSGQVGALTNKIRGLASDYMVPVSDEWAYESAVKIATGQMAEVDAENYMRDMARSRFGHLEDVYDRGLTTRQYMEPYIQRYSQLMETNPNDIDPMENKHLSRIVDYRDPDSGDRRSMTLAESEDYLRSTDEWHKTDNARGQFADMAKGLMSFFGKAS